MQKGGEEMKRILVTGASGFIGHHLIKQLKKEGFWVRGVDWVHPDNKEWACETDEFMHADLTNRKGADLAVEGIDEVYALAAEQGGIGYVSLKENQAIEPYDKRRLKKIRHKF